MKCIYCRKKTKQFLLHQKCREPYFNSSEFINLEEELFGEYKKEMERMKKEWES